MDEHLRAISRVYGPETWEVYEQLDRSLDPRDPDMLLALAAERLNAGSVVLDVGCRDASHLTKLVQATGARGIGIDPLERFVERARASVADAGLADRIQIVQGTMQAIPAADGSVDLVWCRDVIELLEHLDAAVAEVARVLRPGACIVAYTVLAGDRLEPGDAALLAQNLTLVAASMDEENVEGAFARAGLTIERKDSIGTEWREHLEERTQPVSRGCAEIETHRGGGRRGDLRAHRGESPLGRPSVPGKAPADGLPAPQAALTTNLVHTDGDERDDLPLRNGGLAVITLGRR
jgi:SAM-dependent methyltransferase